MVTLQQPWLGSNADSKFYAEFKTLSSSSDHPLEANSLAMKKGEMSTRLGFLKQ